VDKIIIKITTIHKVFILSECVEAGGYIPFSTSVLLAGLISYSATSLSRNTTFCHACRLSFKLSLTRTVHPIPHTITTTACLLVPMHTDTYHRTEPILSFFSPCLPRRCSGLYWHILPPSLRFIYVAAPSVLHLSIPTVPKLGLVSPPVSFSFVSFSCYFFSPFFEMITCESRLLV